MKLINIDVLDEYIKGAGVSIGAEKSYSDVALRITFSEMWQGLSKTITWVNAYGLNPTIVLVDESTIEDGSYTVAIPSEAKEYAGTVRMSIRGAKNSKATLTATAEFKVLEAIYDEDAEEAIQPTPEMVDQLQSQISSISSTISQAKQSATSAATSATSAANSAYNAAMSDASANSSATIATTKASQASDSQASADNYSKQARQYATQANTSKNSASASEIAAAASAVSASNSASKIENLTVTASTGTEGSAATVAKTEISGHYNLHFSIPKGDTGATGLQGPKGDPGNRGEQGLQGIQGEAGRDGVNGIAVATTGYFTFNVDSDGMLWCEYTGDTAPNITLESDGHLYLTI